MAYKIVAAECTACGACEFECPNKAIKEDAANGVFFIDEAKCAECEGQFDEPQCIVACPVDDCIVQIAA